MTTRKTRPTSAIAICVIALLALAPFVSADAATPTKFGRWGVDLDAMDKTVDPGDDFFRYVNGTWIRNTPIPADRSRWGSFDMLNDRSQDDVIGVVEDAAKTAPQPGTVADKVITYYRTYLDIATIDRLGLAPARDDLSAIASATTHDAIVGAMLAPGVRATGPVAISVGLDAKQPDRYVVYISQSGLGMPDRDHYLRTDARSAEIRAKYRDYVETLLSASGGKDAARLAAAIVALETKIAAIHWPREKSRNRDLTYNPRTRSEIEKMAPGFPWSAALDAFGIPSTHDTFVVSQVDAIQSLASLFRDTPVDAWRAYATFHYLNAMAEVLPGAYDRASFEFNEHALLGQAVQRDRRKRAVVALSGRTFQAPMGEAVAQLYVARHFRPAAKAAMAELVENLRQAYRVRIARLAWMTEETRRAATRKLDTLRVKIGYPELWRDYSTLDIRAGDALGNRKRELAFNRARDIVRLGRAADRTEWAITPQIVNAYYNPPWNEIVFPAAILQPPFFDAGADPAVNYGAIGAVIGHEMGHGFDDQGAKSDEHGILRSWWNERDEKNFRALGDRLAEQYSQFEPLPGIKLNGRLTLGENIGDLGGLNVALEAYRISLKGSEPPVLDGYTGMQRFFLGFGQIWRSTMREAALRSRLVADTHSPAEIRANGTVRNMDEWYAAFGVKPTAKLYLPPEARVRVW